jgi:hypothetical protein
MILICLGFRKAGVLDKEINIEHYHDLGKWLFAMSCFYTYMAFFAIPADLVRQPPG